MDDSTLQSEDSWDWDKAERRKGRKNGRAVVSVALSREDFERLAADAWMKQIPVSRLIRERALYWLYPPPVENVMYVNSDSTNSWAGPGAPCKTGDGRDVERAIATLLKRPVILP